MVGWKASTFCYKKYIYTIRGDSLRSDEHGKMPTVQTCICFEMSLFLTVANFYSFRNKCLEIMIISVMPLSEFLQYMICLLPSILYSPKLQRSQLISYGLVVNQESPRLSTITNHNTLLSSKYWIFDPFWPLSSARTVMRIALQERRLGHKNFLDIST